jgi:methyl-accepting chemotaxis protein
LTDNPEDMLLGCRYISLLNIVSYINHSSQVLIDGTQNQVAIVEETSTASDLMSKTIQGINDRVLEINNNFSLMEGKSRDGT